MSNDTQLAALMALVDKYGEACDNSTIGKHGTRAQAARAAVEASARQLAEQAALELCERICAAIKAADDKATDEAGYMLDSNDCIAIVQHQFAARPLTAAPIPEASGDGEREALPKITWPKSKDVGRSGDMTPPGQSVLRVGLDSDNDVYVNLWDNGRHEGDFQTVSIEFCNGGGGGGKSPRTRAALINLMTAIEQDNEADPSKDWQATRRAQKGKA